MDKQNFNLQAKQMFSDSMLRTGFAILKSNEQSLIEEYMPKTGVGPEETLREIKASILANPWGFVFKMEARKFDQLQNAQKEST